jgi:1-aminocyclopropane-1-carboxylate deaminase/D-cysteine desulfhydrase-like pyridoxal-dependent ACC family enzyme
MLKQMNEQKIKADHLFLAAGSSGTISGFHVGSKYFKADFKINGVSVRAKKEELQQRIASLSNDTANFLETGATFTPEEITIYDGYVGGGYGVTTPECLDAIILLARTEGIFLDPVYSAKAMSGLIDLIRQKKFSANDTIIFLATGGGPSVFAYSDELLARLGERR